MQEIQFLAGGPPWQVYCHQSNGAWVDDVVFQSSDAVLDGTFQFMAFFDVIGHARIEGTLQNRNSNNYTMTVTGDLTNNGTIQDNFYNCYIHITGNINQNGIWTNNHTYLAGEHFQFFNFTTPFNGQYLTNTITTMDVGYFISMSDLTFNNTVIDLNGDTLMFETAADSLILNGGYIIDGSIIKVDYTKTYGFLNLTQTGNAYYQDMVIECENIGINGTFEYRTPISFYGHVSVNGTFHNDINTNHTANFYGNLTNNGTIQNNFYTNSIYITGDINQNGTWINHMTYLSGDEDQSLSFTTPFEGTNLVNSNTNGKVIGNSNLVFSNTKIDFNNDTLIFAIGADNLTINQQYCKNITITKESNKTAGLLNCTQTSNAYFANAIIAAENINLAGIVEYRSPMSFYGTVTVSGTLHNDNNTNHTAYIYGNITNNGIIQNNYYNNSLYITGDIAQNGTWSNYYTYFSGSSSQNLSQTQEFTGTRIVDTDPASSVIGTSDLTFYNTDFDLDGANLIMADFSILTLDACWIKNATILSNGFDMVMSSGSYMWDATVNNATFVDHVQTHGTCILSGTTTVEGILSNTTTTHCFLTVEGDLINNGSIQDNFYNLYMNVDGDISNNGSWTNTWTQLDGYNGSVDQTIDIQNGNDITGQIRLSSHTASTYLWHWNGGSLFGNPDFSFQTSQVLYFLVPVSASKAGTYNCDTDLGWSRNIFVTTNTVTVPQVEIDIAIEGPFNGTDMNTDLNLNGNVPLSQPYNDHPVNFWGPESVTAIPNANIVDWVFIEFRDAVDAASATESTMIDRKAAFLLNDGSIVGLDGISNLFFTGTVANNLFVVVLHRNHVDILSASPLTEVSGLYSYDFKTAASQAFGTSAQTNLGGGTFGMYGGDANGDGDVDGDDFILWQRDVGFGPAYDMIDLNMDNQIDNQDKNDVWLDNNGTSSQVPE